MLKTLQQYLERLYELEVGHQVDDFVITDPKLARLLDDGPDRRDSPEKLLVRQDDDNLDLSLYLDRAVLDRLQADDPDKSLHRGNLGDFCLALEGVSHFVYLLWNVACGRKVTLMELELQAEIDKYMVVSLLMGRQRDGRIPVRLRRWLFDDPQFDNALKAQALDRYRDANRYAGKYCSQLEQRYLYRSRRHDNSLLNDVRQFYRLPLGDKIRRIECPV